MSDLKRHHIGPDKYVGIISQDTGRPLTELFPDGIVVTTIDGEIARLDKGEVPIRLTRVPREDLLDEFPFTPTK
jgi:hypothetical protein